MTDARWSEWLLALRHKWYKNCMAQCAQPVANVTNFKWSMTNFFTGCILNQSGTAGMNLEKNISHLAAFSA